MTTKDESCTSRTSPNRFPFGVGVVEGVGVGSFAGDGVLGPGPAAPPKNPNPNMELDSNGDESSGVMVLDDADDGTEGLANRPLVGLGDPGFAVVIK